MVAANTVMEKSKYTVRKKINFKPKKYFKIAWDISISQVCPSMVKLAAYDRRKLKKVISLTFIGEVITCNLPLNDYCIFML